MVSINTVFAYHHNLFSNCVSRVAICDMALACVDWVFIIFEIMFETVKTCFMTWTKKKTYSSWLTMSLIEITHVVTVHIICFRARHTESTADSTIDRVSDGIFYVYNYFQFNNNIETRFLRSIPLLFQNTNAVSVSTCRTNTSAFIKSPRTTFFHERRTEGLAFHAQWRDLYL